MTLAIRDEALAPRSSMSVTLSERWLQVSFSEAVRACSWAIVGGGLVDIDHVAWCEVRDIDLRPPVDAHRYLAERLQLRGLTRAVGLLTSRRVDTFSEARAELHGQSARCIATVGLGNALRAGDPAGIAGRIGTINLLVHVNVPLTDEALLEASAIATEAKTAALFDAGIASRRTGRPATGTGTDCTAVTSARSSDPLAPPLAYAGKHTTVGSLVGNAVEAAVSEGIARWKRENGQ